MFPEGCTHENISMKSKFEFHYCDRKVGDCATITVVASSRSNGHFVVEPLSFILRHAVSMFIASGASWGTQKIFLANMKKCRIRCAALNISEERRFMARSTCEDLIMSQEAEHREDHSLAWKRFRSRSGWDTCRTNQLAMMSFNTCILSLPRQERKAHTIPCAI